MPPGLFVQALGERFLVVDATGVTSPAPAACLIFTAADADPQAVGVAVSAGEAAVREVLPTTGECRVKFSTPVAMKTIAVAPNGTIATISATPQFGSDVLYVFSASGTLQLSNALHGPGGGSSITSLRTATAMDFGPDGFLYVTDRGTLLGPNNTVLVDRPRVWKVDPLTGIGFLQYFTFAANRVDGLGDFDINAAGLARFVSGTRLNTYSVGDWTLQSSVRLDRDTGGGGAMVGR